MTASVIALPLKGSALRGLDAAATEMLAAGRAPNLTAARISLLLKSIHVQRAELMAVIDNLQARLPSGDAQVDRLNADLRVEAVRGLGQINQMIRLIDALQPAAAIKDLPG